MIIRHQVRFALTSRHVTASELADQLRLAPDESALLGDRRMVPPSPDHHAWRVLSRNPAAPIRDQIFEVAGRLRPFQDRIARLSRDLAAADSGHGGATLDLVPHLAMIPEPLTVEPLAVEPERDPLEEWATERSVLEFLLATAPAFDQDLFAWTPRA